MTSPVASLEFLTGISTKALRAIHALAAAESLTDDLARRLLLRRGISGRHAEHFLEALHCSASVVPRNGEWQFSARVRAAIRQSTRERNEDLSDIHQLLLNLCDELSRPDGAMPAYLSTRAGQAYHTGELGQTPSALDHYAKAADSADTGEIWLAGALAQEQQNAGVLPPEAIEPRFLRAYAAYRGNEEERALSELLEIAGLAQQNEFVAWSMQLVGSIEARRNNLPAALGQLDRAVDLFEHLRSWSRLPWALAARAAVLRRLERLPDALNDLRRAASFCEGDWKANFLCRAAAVERDLGRLDDAIADLDLAEQIADRARASVLVQRAGLKRQLDDFVGALDDLEHAILASHGEQRSIILNTRASVFWDLGRMQEALADLDSALAFAPESILAATLNTRSCVRRDTGDLSGALADNMQIGALPASLRYAMDMKVIGKRSTFLRRELATLGAANNEAAQDVFWCRYFILMAQASMRAHAAYRAVALARLALDHARTDRERAECLRHIGLAYEKTFNDKAQAEEPLRRAVELDPSDDQALATLGRVLDVLDRPIEVTEPYFVRAVEACASNRWAKSWYALALSRAGRHAEAARYAEESTQGHPHAILVFNRAVVLDASSDPADRSQALKLAREARDLARPPFDEPERFLAERGE